MPHAVRTTVAALLGLGLIAVSTRAHAQATVVQPGTRPHTASLFDEDVRSLFRGSQQSTRQQADAASTVFLAAMVAAPYANAFATVFALHGNARDALMLSLVNTESLMLTYGAVFLAKTFVSRARPYTETDGMSAVCTADPSDPRCASDRNQSFFSGHTAIAFASAGLLCTQQIEFGGGAGNWGALNCGGAMAMATATGVLRMVADMHYATDTMVGAAVGIGFGLLLPMALHFAPWSPFPVGRSLRAAAAEARDDARIVANAGPHPRSAAAGEDPPLPRARHGFVAGFQLSPWTTTLGGGGVSLGVTTF